MRSVKGPETALPSGLDNGALIEMERVDSVPFVVNLRSLALPKFGSGAPGFFT